MEAMSAPKFWKIVPTLLVAGVVGMAYAKLPPLSDEAKAKAKEAAAKKGEAAKKASAALEKAMDRVAERYKREKGIKTVAAAPAPAAKKK
ncbi:MAG: formate dehydrogenase [Betaproteobacteria bacterium]|nr:formate dehydrogenase [Betaproteobacteria bacterium]